MAGICIVHTPHYLSVFIFCPIYRVITMVQVWTAKKRSFISFFNADHTCTVVGYLGGETVKTYVWGRGQQYTDSRFVEQPSRHVPIIRRMFVVISLKSQPWPKDYFYLWYTRVRKLRWCKCERQNFFSPPFFQKQQKKILIFVAYFRADWVSAGYLL